MQQSKREINNVLLVLFGAWMVSFSLLLLLFIDYMYSSLMCIHSCFVLRSWYLLSYSLFTDFLSLFVPEDILVVAFSIFESLACFLYGFKKKGIIAAAVIVVFLLYLNNRSFVRRDAWSPRVQWKHIVCKYVNLGTRSIWRSPTECTTIFRYSCRVRCSRHRTRKVTEVSLRCVYDRFVSKCTCILEHEFVFWSRLCLNPFVTSTPAGWH